MPYNIFDYVNNKGTNEFKEWSRKLQKIQRAKLNEKLDKLMLVGDGLMPELLTDAGITNIKKLRIKVQNVQLRPLLCNGPIDKESEYTLLMGAKEVGDKWEPKSAPQKAFNRMQEVTTNPAKKRRKHERVS